jgi:hypothetical protein
MGQVEKVTVTGDLQLKMKMLREQPLDDQGKTAMMKCGKSSGTGDMDKKNT